MTEVQPWSVPGGPAIGVRRWGNDGPPVVLLHGLSASSAHYESLAPDLVRRGWHVAALDFRGHGGSDRVPGTYVIEHYAADVTAFLDAIGEPVVLAGHSLGGATTVFVAGARPDLVRAAFAEDPPLYHGMPGVMAATPYVPIFAALRDAMRRLQGEGNDDGAVREFLLAMTIGGQRWADTVAPETVDARVQSFRDCDPSVWDPAIAGVALAGWDPERAVSVPLTVLRADPALGAALTEAEAASFHAANPAARIVEVAGAPHGIREHTATTARYREELFALLDEVR